MNPFGRIAVCGAIATYNDKERPRVPMTSHSFVFNVSLFYLSFLSRLSCWSPYIQQLKMEGFLVTRWLDRWEEGIKQMATWVMQGKIQTEETVMEGFEKMPDALIGLFTGSNKGKMVVKAWINVNETTSAQCLKITSKVSRFTTLRMRANFRLALVRKFKWDISGNFQILCSRLLLFLFWNSQPTRKVVANNIASFLHDPIKKAKWHKKKAVKFELQYRIWSN